VLVIEAPNTPRDAPVVKDEVLTTVEELVTDTVLEDPTKVVSPYETKLADPGGA
jgi:hypothetical protein